MSRPLSDYRQELSRRIKQFQHYLKRMAKRLEGLTEGNCFIVFDGGSNDDFIEWDTDDSGESNDRMEIDVTFWNPTGKVNDALDVDLPDEGWRSDGDSSRRFIQFSFNPRYFDLDIPNTILSRDEAETILRSRSGFFYVTDRPQFEHPAENASRFKPLRKVYVPGDESSAAEDIAFIWFTVWKFPVDWVFSVTAAAFHEKTNWEKDVPIE